MTAPATPESQMTPHDRYWAAVHRQRAAAAALKAERKARGVIGLRCPACGHTHRSLYAEAPCRAAHPDSDGFDGEICGNPVLEEVFAQRG